MGVWFFKWGERERVMGNCLNSIRRAESARISHNASGEFLSLFFVIFEALIHERWSLVRLLVVFVFFWWVFFLLVGLNTGSGSKWLISDWFVSIDLLFFSLFTKDLMDGNWTKFDKLCLYYVCLASFLQKRKSQSGSFDSWILSYWCLCGKFSSKKEKCLCGKWVQFFSCLGINF